MPDLPVVVPWRPGCPHRERAWAHLFPLHIAAGRTVHVATFPPGPLRKAIPVADGVRRARPGIVVIADADVWCDGIDQAAAAVAAGAPWAIPHLKVHRLTEEATADVYNGGELGGPTVEPPYRGVAGGGIVVTTTALVEQVPMDPRFEGWGQEDQAWAAALHATVGPPWRGTADLFHLWHPPQQRSTRRHGSKNNQQLWRRYQRALRLAGKNDPTPMRTLLEEARHALGAEPLRDRGPLEVQGGAGRPQGPS